MDEANSPEDILRGLEERLLQADVRNSVTELDALLAADFLEFSSSGRVYNKQQVITALQQEAPAPISLTDFCARRLSAEIVLVTYQAIRPGRAENPAVPSLRSSLWQWRDRRWQIVFHQGTPRNAE